MLNFAYHQPTNIIFGKDTEQKVGAETKRYADKVLLHYGGGSIKKTGVYDRVCASLQQAGVTIVELPGAQPNPRLSLVQEGIALCRKEQVPFILAVGGGSVIDSAKAIAVGVSYAGDVWDFFERKAEITTALPIGVVLTIPAAGSEASAFAVVTKEAGWYKRDIASELIRPKFAILNPELTMTLSVEQTMIGIADIMAHLLERYFTQVDHVELTDRLIEAALKTIIRNAQILVRDPNNYAARAEILWAGTLAHNDLLSSGRIGDWASHGIEHELSAIYDIPHGAGLSVIIPAWMRYVYTANIRKFTQFGFRVFNIEPDDEFPENAALEAIARLRGFYQSVGLPVSLRELQIPDDRLAEMAAKCTENGPIGNFKKLDQADVLAIYKRAQ